jgi:hypothetical protein
VKGANGGAAFQGCPHDDIIKWVGGRGSLHDMPVGLGLGLREEGSLERPPHRGEEGRPPHRGEEDSLERPPHRGKECSLERPLHQGEECGLERPLQWGAGTAA